MKTEGASGSKDREQQMSQIQEILKKPVRGNYEVVTGENMTAIIFPTDMISGGDPGPKDREQQIAKIQDILKKPGVEDFVRETEKNFAEKGGSESFFGVTPTGLLVGLKEGCDPEFSSVDYIKVFVSDLSLPVEDIKAQTIEASFSYNSITRMRDGGTTYFPGGFHGEEHLELAELTDEELRQKFPDDDGMVDYIRFIKKTRGYYEPSPAKGGFIRIGNQPLYPIEQLMSIERTLSNGEIEAKKRTDEEREKRRKRSELSKNISRNDNSADRHLIALLIERGMKIEKETQAVSTVVFEDKGSRELFETITRLPEYRFVGDLQSGLNDPRKVKEPLVIKEVLTEKELRKVKAFALWQLAQKFEDSLDRYPQGVFYGDEKISKDFIEEIRSEATEAAKGDSQMSQEEFRSIIKKIVDHYFKLKQPQFD